MMSRLTKHYGSAGSFDCSTIKRRALKPWLGETAALRVPNFRPTDFFLLPHTLQKLKGLTLFSGQIC